MKKIEKNSQELEKKVIGGREYFGFLYKGESIWVDSVFYTTYSDVEICEMLEARRIELKKKDGLLLASGLIADVMSEGSSEALYG